MKLFIVEDEEFLQELYADILKQAGFKIIGFASNGVEAIKKYKSFSEKPDVIIMDHRMPIKNGIETSKEILKMDKNTKILLTTADRTVLDEALKIEVLHIKLKPFTIKKLISNINKLI